MITTWKLTSRATVCGVLVSQMRSFLLEVLAPVAAPHADRDPVPLAARPVLLHWGDDASPAAAVGPQVVHPVAAAPEPGVHDERQLPPADDPVPPASGRPHRERKPARHGIHRAHPSASLGMGRSVPGWAKLLPREFLKDFTTPETCFWLA